MKVLSITIPCYNSAEYMEKCIESLLVDLDNIEIIIVNDGSTKDNTAEIADKYKEIYPNTVKVIHKTNGGHGSAVNAGLENATGKYFKVVDSDDRLDSENLKKVLDFLKTSDVDMLISNFVYDKVGQKNKKVMQYDDIMPVEEIFTWDDMKKFHMDQYLLMHAIIHKTSVLRDCGLKLPEHTFYVDNLYVYAPLPYVKTMYYFNFELYYYFIGRGDQSVNEKVMLTRLDQQVRVNKLLFDAYDLDQMERSKVRCYMYQHLIIITAVSCVLMYKEGSNEKLAMKDELWAYMKKQNYDMYKKLKYKTVLGQALHMPGGLSQRTLIRVYHMLQRHMGFN